MSIKPPFLTYTSVNQEQAPETGLKHHFKRVLVVASLYFRLQGNQCPSEKELEKVNQSFQLAWRCDALRFPAAVSCIIWRRIDPRTILEQYCKDQTSIRSLAKRLLDTLPTWLRYRGIMDDICGVFTTLRTA